MNLTKPKTVTSKALVLCTHSPGSPEVSTGRYVRDVVTLQGQMWTLRKSVKLRFRLFRGCVREERKSTELALYIYLHNVCKP